jgi:hypothetical protein
MSVIKIITKDQLADWLDERGWLDLAHVHSLNPPPGSPDAPTTKCEATFRLEVWVSGSLDAGDPQQFEQHDVQAIGVTTWSAREPEWYDDETFVHDLELDETSERLRLIFDENLILECTALHLSEPKPLTRHAIPGLWDSHCELLIGIVPTPMQWVGWFADVGLDVSFRILGDAARPINQVPALYEGWFIQETSRLGDTKHGLMVKGISRCEEGWNITFDFWRDREAPEKHLWVALVKVISTRFPNNQVTSGNCSLTGSQWLRAIEQGQPYLNSLFLKNENIAHDANKKHR